MLAAIIAAQIEPDHDTDLDVRSPEHIRRLRRRAREAREANDARRREMMTAPVWRGTRVERNEELSPASVARIRLREAVVRLQRAALEEMTARRDGLPEAPPEVRIDWVRSTDGTQRIARVGRDGFEIRDVADGTSSGRRSTSASVLSIGIEGVIFSVPLRQGDTPSMTIDRLVARIASAYDVEIRCDSDRKANAILKLPR